MARTQLRTFDYPEGARVRLGKAVEKARISAGHPKRPSFVALVGISLRSLAHLEQADRNVTSVVLYPVANALPNWTIDTPEIILNGGPIPPVAAKPPLLPVNFPEELPLEIPDLSDLPLTEQRDKARQVMDRLPILQKKLDPDAYRNWRDLAMRFVARYGDLDVADSGHAADIEGAH